MVYGAMIGDIAGSRFEFSNYRGKDFEIFSKDSFVTDDTIMTLAVAVALEKSKKNDFKDLRQNAIKYMQGLGRPYPNAGWGGRFGQWIYSDDPQPYNSFGNGAAMRVGPVGWYAKSLAQAMQLADAVTDISHDHEEGLKGARAVASLVYMAKNGYTKEQMREVAEIWYKLDFTLDEIRPTYQFNETCQETVPQAIVAFLESEDFESTIRNAVSVGGDSDTLAAIAGSIAEAYYGVPAGMKEWAKGYLDEILKAACEAIDK